MVYSSKKDTTELVGSIMDPQVNGPEEEDNEA